MSATRAGTRPAAIARIIRTPRPDLLERVRQAGSSLPRKRRHNDHIIAPNVMLHAAMPAWTNAAGTASRNVGSTARTSLAFRKRTQPLHLPSAGCIFQNPDPTRDRVPPDVPCSAGALIDRAGLKSTCVGGAMVSEVHANFLVNAGGASAADILDLVALVERTVHERFGVTLRREIAVMGEH